VVAAIIIVAAVAIVVVIIAARPAAGTERVLGIAVGPDMLLDRSLTGLFTTATKP
jgi:hypothetical protein